MASIGALPTSRNYRLYRPRRGLGNPSGGTPKPAGEPIERDVTPLDTFANQVKSWNEQLTAVKDQEALQNLANGHTAAFVSYAQSRLADPNLPADQKLTWQADLSRAQQKIEDDGISAEVSAGVRPLEDLHDHLVGRANALGPTDPDYAGVVKQIADVKNAMVARDFNGAVNDAQMRFVQSGGTGHQQYISDLQGILQKTTDPTTRTAVMGQIAKEQQAITAQQATDNGVKADGILTSYLKGAQNGGLSGTDAISQLSDLAQHATSATEAHGYATTAQQIDTRERELQRTSLSGAAAAGGKALTNALVDTKGSFEAATSALKQQLDTGTPDQQTLALYKKSGQDYLDGLQSALPQATTPTTRASILAAIASTQSAMAGASKTVATAVVSDVEKQSVTWRGQVGEAERAAAAETDPTLKAQYLDTASQLRYLWAQHVQSAKDNPLVTASDTQKDRLDAMLNGQSGPIYGQKNAISVAASVAAGTDPTTSAAYQSYVKALTDQQYVHDAKGNYTGAARMDENGNYLPPVSPADFAAVISGTMRDEQGNLWTPQMVARDLGFGAGPVGADGAQAIPDVPMRFVQNLLTTYQSRAAQATAALNVYTAPRDENGQRVGAFDEQYDNALSTLFGTIGKPPVLGGEAPTLAIGEGGGMSAPSAAELAAAPWNNPPSLAQPEATPEVPSSEASAGPSPFDELGGVLGGIGGAAGDALGGLGGMLGSAASGLEGMFGGGGVFGASSTPDRGAQAALDAQPSVSLPNFELPDLPAIFRNLFGGGQASEPTAPSPDGAMTPTAPTAPVAEEPAAPMAL